MGYVVAMNMVYQLESLGINCSNWNNTGPTRKDDPGAVWMQGAVLTLTLPLSFSPP